MSHVDKGKGFTHHDDSKCCACKCKKGEKMKPTARIRPAKDGALWLFVDYPGENKTAAEDLNAFIQDTLGVREEEGIAYAILPEEVEAIRDACSDYLGSDLLKEIQRHKTTIRREKKGESTFMEVVPLDKIREILNG